MGRNDGTDRNATAAAWAHLTVSRKNGGPSRSALTVPLPDMGRNDLIALAARLRIDAAALLTDILFLERIASEMPGPCSVVSGTHTAQDLEDIRDECERLQTNSASLSKSTPDIR